MRRPAAGVRTHTRMRVNIRTQHSTMPVRVHKRAPIPGPHASSTRTQDTTSSQGGSCTPGFPAARPPSAVWI